MSIGCSFETRGDQEFAATTDFIAHLDTAWAGAGVDADDNGDDAPPPPPVSEPASIPLPEPPSPKEEFVAWEDYKPHEVRWDASAASLGPRRLFQCPAFLDAHTRVLRVEGRPAPFVTTGLFDASPCH